MSWYVMEKIRICLFLDISRRYSRLVGHIPGRKEESVHKGRDGFWQHKNARYPSSWFLLSRIGLILGKFLVLAFLAAPGVAPAATGVG